MEFRGFFKNTSMKRGDQMKHEVTRQNKLQRAKSRHEMRQTFRNMGCDPDDENEAPPGEDMCDDFLQHQQPLLLHNHQSAKLGENMTTKNKNLSQEDRFQIRLMRLQEFRERKRRMQLEQQKKPTIPFIPFVCKSIIVSEAKGLQSVEGARQKLTPLGESQEQTNQISARSNNTPVVLNKCIKPRVDCWRLEKLPRKAIDGDQPAAKPASEKKTVHIKSVERPKVSKPILKQRAKEPKVPAVVQPAKQVRHAVPTRPVAARPLSQKKQEFVFNVKPPSVPDTGTSSKIVTSTVRKHRKPLLFSFEHASEIKKPKATLTVNRADELFDGISPIEVESFVLKPATVNDVKHSSPTAETVAEKKEESLWEPQAVACLSVNDTTVHGNGNSVAAVAETKLKRDCSISDWVPARVHEITSDSIIIVDDGDDDVGDDEVFKDDTITLSVGNVLSNDLLTVLPLEPKVVRLSAEHMEEITGIVPSDISKEGNTTQPVQVKRKSSPKENKIGFTNGRVSSDRMAESEIKQPIQERRTSSPKESKKGHMKGRVSSVPLNESEIKQPIQERRTSSPKAHKIELMNGRVSFDRLKESEMKQPIQERRNSSPKETKLNGSAIRKRASLIFTEEPIECDIVPSKSNLTLAEKQRLSLEEAKSSTNSSPRLSNPSQSSPDEPDGDTKPPKEVEEKTRYYYDKVDSELVRLQALCDEYAPYLAEEQELNDHCRGLIIAAQGQTNILIKKKLTKFRELIGHYETKWNDRKVRHDDLDGFWVMLSLDLDNLDKRFDELRTLKANNWQEIVPEPKVKKLQGGGGVRKREKKPSAAQAKKSSGIADLIRKARQEAKQKQKTAIADLDVLKETVTVVTTPIKRAVRFEGTPKRTSLAKRSSLCAGCTPTTVHWNQESDRNLAKRHTIFPEITQQKSELVKSILKPAKVTRSRRAKSVLFLDGGLDTPQTRRRHSSRTIVDTPKPKIKFNEELEIEHIDNLAARTPSRLELEIQKRRQQSLLESATLLLPSSDDTDKDAEQQTKKKRKPYAQGTPHRDSGSVRRSNRRTSRCIAALFDEESSNNASDFKTEEDSKGSAKRATRASRNARKKSLQD